MAESWSDGLGKAQCDMQPRRGEATGRGCDPKGEPSPRSLRLSPCETPARASAKGSPVPTAHQQPGVNFILKFFLTDLAAFENFHKFSRL